MRTYIFFKKGKRSQPLFEIEAPNPLRDYNDAREAYGPCVDDLLYTEKGLDTGMRICTNFFCLDEDDKLRCVVQCPFCERF